MSMDDDETRALPPATSPPEGEAPTLHADELTRLGDESGDARSAGNRIGPYELIEKLGEGGMGDVWLAEQRKPVHRRVALKVIKRGMDSEQLVARFEVERQALAMMDHPSNPPGC